MVRQTRVRSNTTRRRLTMDERRGMKFRAAALTAMTLGLTLDQEQGYEHEATFLLGLAAEFEAKANSLIGDRPGVMTEGDGLRQAADLIDILDHADGVMRAAGGKSGDPNWPVDYWDEDGRQWDARRLFPGAFKQPG